MRHTSLALNRPVTTVMVFLAVLAVGLISAKLLRLENFPDITFPGMQVTIPYPGSTPEEMEQLVVRPVEEALATLSGIEEIQATARPDEAQFTVLFNWDRDTEKAAFEVARDLGLAVTTHAGVWGATNDDGIRLIHENGFAALNYKPGTRTDYDNGMAHRVENPGSEVLVFIEVQRGDYLGEDDIVRLQDDYGRSR